MGQVLQVGSWAQGCQSFSVKKKNAAAKPKEVKTGCNLAESSTEGHGSKRAVLPVMTMMIMMMNDCSASEEVPSILRNPKIHYHAQKSPPLAISSVIRIQFTLSHPTRIHLRSMSILSFHLCHSLPSYLFPSGFPVGTCALFKGKYTALKTLV
jgi:hypothetical protein